MKRERFILLAAVLGIASNSWAQSLQITNQPADLAVKAGEVAEFAVVVVSPVAANYAWFKDGAQLANNERISGARSARLSLSPAAPGDAGLYSVRVSDGTNTVTSRGASLSVNVDLPAFTSTPVEVHVSSGETAYFSGAASGSSPFSYGWRRDGLDLANGERITGVGTTTLIIGGAVAEDSGWYSLTAANAAGRISSRPARLYVHTSSPLAVAANFDAGVWTTGGDAVWYALGGVSQDGNALSNQAIGDSKMTYIETTVYGPGELQFWWRVSSETPDLLQLFVNGVALDRISGEVDWTQRTFHLGSGRQVLRWQYSKDGSIAKGQDRGFVDQVSFTPTPKVSLEQALNNAPLPLVTYGDDLWFGQTLTNHDGFSAARSGYLLDNQSSTVETTVSGPGWISFTWKVSSEGADPLKFLVDQTEWGRISGETDWTNQTFHIPWGRHTLGWRYQKDYSITKGSDAAWLDQVSYRPVGLFDLAQASDWSGSAWSSGGQGPWFGQNEYTSDGMDALQSSPIPDNGTTFVDTTVDGPGTLVFKWKVSSENSDPLTFSVNGSEWGRISGEVEWTTVTNVIRPGVNLLRWQYSKDYSISRGLDAGWVDAVNFVAAPPLAHAVNAPALQWTTSAKAGWFSEMVDSHDGTAAARSGDITHNQSSDLQTTVMGPGPGSFYWKVSAESTDPLIFLIDDGEVARLTGERGWTLQEFTVPAGLHTLTWRYQKDYSVNRGQDAAWMDEFSFVGASVVVSSPVLKNGSFRLAVPSKLGWNYFLEYKNNLEDPAWLPLSGVAGTGSQLIMTDPTATVPKRFYRVRAE